MTTQHSKSHIAQRLRYALMAFSLLTFALGFLAFEGYKKTILTQSIALEQLHHGAILKDLSCLSARREIALRQECVEKGTQKAVTTPTIDDLNTQIEALIETLSAHMDEENERPQFVEMAALNDKIKALSEKVETADTPAESHHLHHKDLVPALQAFATRLQDISRATQNKLQHPALQAKADEGGPLPKSASLPMLEIAFYTMGALTLLLLFFYQFLMGRRS